MSANMKPILFSGPMVRALIEGRKTQTRRIIKSVRVFATPETRAFSLKGDELKRALQNASRFRLLEGDGWFWEADAFEWQRPAERTGWMAHIGYAVGDLIYVRENAYFGPNRCAYAASNPPLEKGERVKGFGKMTPSIHMPRWASRITLEVTDVRVERVQDISKEDAIAEGVARNPVQDATWMDYPEGHSASGWEDPVLSFKSLWNSLNEKRGVGWDANPWVCAITFIVHKQNIDALLKERAA